MTVRYLSIIMFVVLITGQLHAQSLRTPIEQSALERIKGLIERSILRVDVILKIPPFMDRQSAPVRNGAAVVVRHPESGKIVIITSLPLVDRADQIHIRFKDTSFDARVVLSDEMEALALLVVGASEFYPHVQPLDLAPVGSTHEYQQVMTLRNLATGLHTVTIGEVFQRLAPPLDEFWLAAPPFHFGFALVNKKGQVQGITIRESYINRDLTVMASARVIWDFLQKSERPVDLTQRRPRHSRDS